MSAAAARRKKQLAMRANASPSPGGGVAEVPASASAIAGMGADRDPIRLRLDALLRDPSLSTESVAYEALQLAQSSVRRYVKLGKYDLASISAYDACMSLLVRGGRVAVSSQLLAVLVNVLSETRTSCTPAWVGRFADIDVAYRNALDADVGMGPDERGRLQRLHLAFLRKVLRWSNDHGNTRHGDAGIHELLGEHCWNMSCDEAVVMVGEAEGDGDGGGNAGRGENEEDDEDDEDDEDERLDIGLRNVAVTHYALAGNVDAIIRRLKTLPSPTPDELMHGHVCPPSQRDALLTRSVLALLAIENLRDAATLVRTYLVEIEDASSTGGRNVDALRAGYLDKTDGIAPSHAIFCSMMIRICEKDVKTAPLFTWLVRNFGPELGTMHDTETVRAYTTKIGRVYFDIQPPPSMMSMMENMMSSMGGGGGGMGGMNPAAMMQAMQAMQGGGM
jgi:hypothetical protein